MVGAPTGRGGSSVHVVMAEHRHHRFVQYRKWIGNDTQPLDSLVPLAFHGGEDGVSVRKDHADEIGKVFSGTDLKAKCSIETFSNIQRRRPQNKKHFCDIPLAAILETAATGAIPPFTLSEARILSFDGRGSVCAIPPASQS